MADNYISSFSIDRERNVTLSLAKFLNDLGWNIVACHPPGGHTSFSILDGRRSKGGYMPDVVAIEKTESPKDVPLVIIAESKPSYDRSDTDIVKLDKLTEIHAQWIAFRLQNHLPMDKWVIKWREKLQKIIAVGEFLRPSIKNIPNDLIVLEFRDSAVPSKNSFIGASAPARRYFKHI